MRSVPLLLTTLLTLVSAAAARADVAPDPEFGESLAVPDKTRVAMTAEEVTVTLLPDRGIVHAVFHLHNTGPRTTLTVGFPDALLGPLGYRFAENRRSGLRLRDFRARVDGAAIEHRVRRNPAGDGVTDEGVGAETEDDERVANWILWEMTFKEDTRRTVTVDYWVPYRQAYRPPLLGDRSFRYILKTGAGWHGPIGKVVIDVRFGEGIGRAHVGEIAPEGWTETEGGLRWERADLDPTDDVVVQVRRWPSHTAAADAYLELAREAREKGDLVAEARRAAAAAECLGHAGRWAACVESCRRLIAIEGAARAGEAGYERLRHVPRGYREPYQVWECRLVEALVALGRVDEARREAPAAIVALRRYQSEADHWRFADAEAIPGRIERYQRFAAGGAFGDE